MTSAPPGLPGSAPASSAAVPSAGETVFQAIAAWARRAPSGRLNAWLVGGIVDAVGVWLFLPVIWPLAPACVSLASVGLWGLATQRLAVPGAAGSPASRRRALEAARFAAVVAGTLAAILAFYGVLLMLLGPSWKL